MIGLDTTALIDLLRNDPALLLVLGRLQGEFVTTAINQQEIYFGLDTTRADHQDEEQYYDSLFRNLVVYPLEINGVKRASEIFWKLKKKVSGPGKFDCMISGVLLSNRVDTVLTKNVKHFEKIPGLKVVGY